MNFTANAWRRISINSRVCFIAIPQDVAVLPIESCATFWRTFFASPAESQMEAFVLGICRRKRADGRSLRRQGFRAIATTVAVPLALRGRLFPRQGKRVVLALRWKSCTLSQKLKPRLTQHLHLHSRPRASSHSSLMETDELLLPVPFPPIT